MSHQERHIHLFVTPLVVLLGLILVALVGCGANPTPAPPPPPPPDNEPSPQPPPSPPADLTFGETRVEANTDTSDTWNQYLIVATIVNLGAGDASGFSAGCTYQCPPGETITSAGLDIVQGGFISANNSFTYRERFHYACLAHPPALDLMCSIELQDGSEKMYSVSVNLP